MIIARTRHALREALGDRIDSHRPTPRPRAFVPTMGALHVGHRRLFEVARAGAATLVASIFVNPRQFNDPADLAAYPRPEADDIAVAQQAGVDVLFMPNADEMYAADDATRVSVAGPAVGFEGASRPGHFDGVATVCLKLFQMVRPDVAYFGQKDAQQVAVIRQLVRDLALDLAIRVVPTVREPDGLAFSSRNARLSPAERAQAAALPRALRAGLRAHRDGRDPAAAARAELADLHVEYAGIARFDGEPILVLAAQVGRTRLIDNVPLDDPARAGLDKDDA